MTSPIATSTTSPNTTPDTGRQVAITASARLFVPVGPAARMRFRVFTPDFHPIATTCEPVLAAATVLAVARHHPARYGTIAAGDGRWLDVRFDGTTTLAPSDAELTGWPAVIEQALGHLAQIGQGRPQRTSR